MTHRVISLRRAGFGAAVTVLLTACGPLTQQQADDLQRQVRDQQARIAVLEQEAERLRKANVIDRADQTARAQAETISEIRQLQEQLAGLEGQVAEVKHTASANHPGSSELPSFVAPPIAGDGAAVPFAPTEPTAPHGPIGHAGMGPTAVTASPDTDAASATQPVVPDAQDQNDPKVLFGLAKQSYDQGDYATARMRFRDYLGRFPKAPEADDAQYWIGASYLAQERPASALGELRKVTEKYPNSNVLDLTLLDMAECFFRLRACEDAKSALQTLMRMKPSPKIAARAEQKLKEINKAPRSSCLR
jgi:TolA-binding protein